MIILVSTQWRSLQRKALGRSIVWTKPAVPQGCRLGCHGRQWDPACKGSLSQRGFWRGFLQSDQAILHKRSSSLMLVQWHLELVVVFLHHTVLFRNVIYRRKKQACPENLILSWLLVLYWEKALLTAKPVWTRRNSNQYPSSLSARKGGTFTGIIIVMWIFSWDLSETWHFMKLDNK